MALSGLNLKAPMSKNKMSSQLEIPLLVEGMTAIYALVDPRTMEVRYVGKANNPKKRLHHHIYDAEHGKQTHNARWIRILLSEALSPTVVILDSVPKSKIAWEEAERRWIAHFRANGAKLTNETDGGDGTDGYVWDREKLAKKSSARRGKPSDRRHSNSTGVSGVYKKREGSFWAEVSINGKRTYLGTFPTLEEAASVRKDAEDKADENPIPKRSDRERVRITDIRNKSGIPGVWLYSRKGGRNDRWRVTFRKKVLGQFETKEEALAVRKAAEDAYLKEINQPSTQLQPCPQ